MFNLYALRTYVIYKTRRGGPVWGWRGGGVGCDTEILRRSTIVRSANLKALRKIFNKIVNVSIKSALTFGNLSSHVYIKTLLWPLKSNTFFCELNTKLTSLTIDIQKMYFWKARLILHLHIIDRIFEL
jgi:hypothetical protein